MANSSFQQFRRYALAIAVVAMAIVVRILVAPYVEDRIPFITVLAAIVFMAGYTGRGPSLFTLVLGLVGVGYFVITPTRFDTLTQPAYLVGVPCFLAICLGTIIVFDRLRAARHQAEASASDAHRQQKLLEVEVAARRRAERDAQDYAILLEKHARLLTEEREILRFREAEFRAAFDTIAVGMGVIDLETLRFIRVNDRYCQITGYSREEMLARTPLDLDHPDDIEEDRQHFDRICSGESDIVHVEKRYVHKSGRIVWVVVNACVVREGRPCSIGVIEDITDRKLATEALRHNESQLRRLFEANLIGVAYSTAEGAFLDGNDEFLRIVGYERADLVAGRVRWKDMTPARYAPGDHSGIAEARRRGACTPYEKEYIRKDGSPVPVLIGYALLEGSDDHFIVLVEDLTRPKQLEAELRRQAEALHEANLRKDEFLAMLGHELRNPLAPIRNALRILCTDGISGDVVTQARAMMERQVEHLVRLVDELLDVSRLVQNKITLHRQLLAVGDLFQRAVETAKPALDAQGHELVIALPKRPILLDGDPVRLSQVVSNLLLNSAKYTEPGGHIWLTAEFDDGEACIRVRDDGVGIAEELLPHVFELFVQADRSLARSQGGLGIGLTLVRKLVELHGGTVEARSAGPGKGSEFVIRLEALSDQRRPESDSRFDHARPDGQSRRVMVVDDNVDVAESAALMLRLWGYEVRTVADGLSALESVAEFLPEVVLLDIGLPGMDGYEVARRLRGRSDSREIRLVALTGYGQEEDRRRALEAGFDCHLIKPLNPDTLAEILASARHAATIG
jgi:PAS domain S-box-containing protein